MKIINSEIKISKTETPNSEYIENTLRSRMIDFVRWAIVSVNDREYVLNVAHKIEE